MVSETLPTAIGSRPLTGVGALYSPTPYLTELVLKCYRSAPMTSGTSLARSSPAGLGF
jgi:hypothetical protein